MSDTPKQWLPNDAMEAINGHIDVWQRMYKRDPKPVDIMRQMHGWLNNYKANHTETAFGLYKSEMHDYIIERVRKTRLKRNCNKPS